MMHQHKYSLSEIENMIPWERHVYLDLLKDHIKQQEERKRDLELARKAKR